MNALESFAEDLKKKRKAENINQEEIAEMIAVTPRWYQKIESGKSKPGFDIICKLAKIFGINYADYVEDEENDNDSKE